MQLIFSMVEIYIYIYIVTENYGVLNWIMLKIGNLNFKGLVNPLISKNKCSFLSSISYMYSFQQNPLTNRTKRNFECIRMIKTFDRKILDIPV